MINLKKPDGFWKNKNDIQDEITELFDFLKGTVGYMANGKLSKSKMVAQSKMIMEVLNDDKKEKRK